MPATAAVAFSLRARSSCVRRRSSLTTRCKALAAARSAQKLAALALATRARAHAAILHPTCARARVSAFDRVAKPRERRSRAPEKSALAACARSSAAKTLVNLHLSRVYVERRPTFVPRKQARARLY